MTEPILWQKARNGAVCHLAESTIPGKLNALMCGLVEDENSPRIYVGRYRRLGHKDCMFFYGIDAVCPACLDAISLETLANLNI